MGDPPAVYDQPSPTPILKEPPLQHQAIETLLAGFSTSVRNDLAEGVTASALSPTAAVDGAGSAPREQEPGAPTESGNRLRAVWMLARGIASCTTISKLAAPG
jgi:hypothetical protein